jgi:hypothetical protein
MWASYSKVAMAVQRVLHALSGGFALGRHCVWKWAYDRRFRGLKSTV